MGIIKTTKTFQIKFTLQELSEWSKISQNFSIETFSEMRKLRGNYLKAKEYFLQFSQDMPPARFWRQMHRLIIDEGIDLHDIVITVVDEDTGKEHPYNPPLEAVFGELVEHLS